MVRFVIVPGIGGSDGVHWQSVWEAELGDRAVRTAPDSWDAPDLDNWLHALDAAVERSVGAAAEPLVLVAHSLGCWATSAWFASRPESVLRPVGAVMLVAPPDPAGPVFPRAEAPAFAELRPETLSSRAPGMRGVVVASQDDQYCTLETAERLAAAWGLPFIDAGAIGHINSQSGLGRWEEGWSILQALIHAA
jgi:predicted alpha/beta hydrolase family esterase